MRVVFVINSLGAGGTERSTAVLLPALRARGVESIVLCLERRDEGDEAAVQQQGFDVRFIVARSIAGRVREVRRLLGELRPDVVHTAIFDADIVGRLAAARTGIPLISSLVNTPYDPSRHEDPNVAPWKLSVVRAIDRWTGRLLVDHFHAVTEGVATDAVASLGIPRSRITVVERGRDVQALGRRTRARREAARRRLGLDDADELVLAVGRHEFQKGHSHLVEAAGRLVDAHPRLVVAIAGRSGNATGELHASIAEAGLGEHVRLLGHRHDVPDLLCAADAFVMSSRYEGTAGAAVEALALETPIVASDLTGTAGVLVDGNDARLVPAGDAMALAKTIDEVLGDPVGAGRRARRGRDLFEQRFTLDRSADRMVELYARLAAPAAAPASSAAAPRAPEPIEYGPDGELALSVVVCVRNGASTMRDQLDALLAQRWGEPWEILVVDNASTDATAAVAAAYAARDARVRVISAPDRGGLSHARNVGVAHARGRAVAFCDDDDRVADGWVAAMGRALASHPVVASRMDYETLTPPAAREGRAAFQSDGIETLFGHPVVNGASGWQRPVWRALGGNDERLDFTGEDLDMSIRAHRQLGIVPYFAADAIYHCRRRVGRGSTFRQARRYGRAQVELYVRHGRDRLDDLDRPDRALRQWAWLVRHLADVWDPSRQTHWAWRAGHRVGRLEGSVRTGVRYF